MGASMTRLQAVLVLVLSVVILLQTVHSWEVGDPRPEGYTDEELLERDDDCLSNNYDEHGKCVVEEQAAAPIPDPVDSRSLAEIRKEALLRNFHANRASSEECMSGYLSDLANTAALRKSFEAILKDYDIKTVFDAGCGDYHWIKNVPGMEKVEYTGVDLIEEVIEANKKKTAGNANVRFVVADLANPDYVMDKAYDLVILRDVVQFQPLRDSLQMMKTIEKSGSKYIFTTFHRGTKFNNDAGYNGNMFADVMISPFNFASDAQLTAFQEHKHLDFPLNAKGMGMWPLPAMHDDPEPPPKLKKKKKKKKTKQ